MKQEATYSAAEHYPFYRLLRDKANASTYGYIPEIALILAVGASYAFWPGSLIAVGEWIQYVLWTYFIGLLVSLAVTNMKTQLLPSSILYIMFNAAVAHTLVIAATTAQSWPLISSALGAFILGVIPYVIYQVSSGKWIGGGDVRLGAVVGLLLGWKLAIVAAVLHMLITLAIFLIFGISQHAEAHKQIRIPSGYIWTLVTIIVYLFGKTILTGLSFA